MTDKNNENLKELLSRFVDPQMASKMADDIEAGDSILRSNPAPRPSPAVLAEIEQKMLAAAQRRQMRSYGSVWRYAAAAAVIVFVFSTSFILFHKQSRHIQAGASESLWQDAFASIENTIDSQFAQLDNSEPDAQLVTLDSAGSPEAAAINDLSNELDDIDATFWEG